MEGSLDDIRVSHRVKNMKKYSIMKQTIKYFVTITITS